MGNYCPPQTGTESGATPSRYMPSSGHATHCAIYGVCVRMVMVFFFDRSCFMAQGQMAREHLYRELVFTVRRDAPLPLTRGQVRSCLCRPLRLSQTGSPAGACTALLRIAEVVSRAAGEPPSDGTLNPCWRKVCTRCRFAVNDVTKARMKGQGRTLAAALQCHVPYLNVQVPLAFLSHAEATRSESPKP